MAQHFLLSAQARSLSLKTIYQGGEERAYETFRKLRWSQTEGEPVCPKCGCLDHYDIPTRRKFKCTACHAQFSVTSGTMFASRKLSFTDLLAAICLFVNGSKGMSAVQFSRDLDVQYKTAFVLAHKLREALAAETATEMLEGEVEIDGAYFGGHVRPENRKEDRIDRRRSEHRSDRRRVVIALRERAGRTLSFVRRAEDEGVEIARARMVAKAKLFADEASHWDVLEWIMPAPASTTANATAKDTASTPTWWKAISAAFAAWLAVSTTTSRTATCTNMRTTPHGLKITVAARMAGMPSPCLAARSIIR